MCARPHACLPVCARAYACVCACVCVCVSGQGRICVSDLEVDERLAIRVDLRVVGVPTGLAN